MQRYKWSHLSKQQVGACIERFVPCMHQPVIASGWIETLGYLQEQSISHDYHRYGNLGRRAQEPRRPLAAPPC